MSTESATNAEERATTPALSSTTNIVRLIARTAMRTLRCSDIPAIVASSSPLAEQQSSAQSMTEGVVGLVMVAMLPPRWW